MAVKWFIKSMGHALARWLTWLECDPMHQKVDLMLIFSSHIDVSLIFPLLSLSSQQKYILGQDKKERARP